MSLSREEQEDLKSTFITIEEKMEIIRDLENNLKTEKKALSDILEDLASSRGKGPYKVNGKEYGIIVKKSGTNFFRGRGQREVIEV